MILFLSQSFQLVLAAICVAEGMRLIVLTGLSKQKMYVVIFGVMICFGNATKCYLDYHFESRGLSLMSKKLELPSLSKDWGADFSVDHRSHASREVARAVFEQNGELRNYFDPKGDYLAFSFVLGGVWGLVLKHKTPIFSAK